MANFPQSFKYEQSVIPLRDGTFFRPLSQGVDRWIVQSESMFDAAPGLSFQILYELVDRTFMVVEYGLCEHFETRGGQKIWIGSFPPRAGRFTPEQALNFIVRHQFSVPDSLLPLLDDPARKPKCRPPEYWAAQPILEQKRPQLAHNVDQLEQADLGHRFLVRFVQELRARDACWHSLKSTDSVTSCLYAIYPVDPRKWWGPKNVFPPGAVPIEDLPWPKELADVWNSLVKIKSLLWYPLSVDQANRYFGSAWYPTPEEQDAAFRALCETLPTLEPLVVELGRVVAVARSAEENALTSSPTTPTEPNDSASGSDSKRRAGPADWQALASYERALQLLGDASATDRRVYDWIKEHGLDGDLEGYKLPEFESWRRFRNRARQEREAAKKAEDSQSPRSAVRPKDL